MKRILVIDDDPAIHALVRAVTNQLGYDLTSAFDAVQGPMKARRMKPDLIVLDINMPGGKGFNILKQLRNMDDTFETPVLVHSAMSQEELEKEIRESPVTFILRKPAAPEELLKVISDLLAS
jgi:DNA-binding response OmpR family regulator